MNTIKSLCGDEFKLLIQERIKNFWGYGNLRGDVWFVGMEEGYNENNEILLERFKATAHAEVFDIYDDLKVDPGHVYWFEDGAPTQSTYRRLIYLLLYLQNKTEPTLEDIRDFQIKKFGRKISNHAALELMPLPAKSINKKDWLYTDADVEGLGSRKQYLEKYKPARVQRLRELIETHKPKIVIFYSRTYLSDWQGAVPMPLDEILTQKLHIAKDHGTLYAVVPHSTAFGVSKSDWKEIAEAILNYP